MINLFVENNKIINSITGVITDENKDIKIHLFDDISRRLKGKNFDIEYSYEDENEEIIKLNKTEIVDDISVIKIPISELKEKSFNKMSIKIDDITLGIFSFYIDVKQLKPEVDKNKYLNLNSTIFTNNSKVIRVDITYSDDTERKYNVVDSIISGSIRVDNIKNIKIVLEEE